MQREYEQEAQSVTRTPRRRRNMRLRSMLILLGLVVLAGGLLLNRERLSFAHLSRALVYHNLGSRTHAEEFLFPSQANNRFAIVGNGIAVASSMGLQVFDRAAESVFRDAAEFANPVIQTAGNYLLVYDLGGFEIVLADRREVIWRARLDEAIIDARVNESGWIAVSTEQIGSRGVVTVIDDAGNHLYRVHSEGHLLAAGLADDGQTLVMLSVTAGGGRVLWYHLARDGTSEAPRAQYLAEDIFFDFWFTSAAGAIGLISSDSVQYVSAMGVLTDSYAFPERHLRSYSVSGGEVAIYLATSRNGVDGSIVRLGEGGGAEHIAVYGQVMDISLNGRYLAVLTLDELRVYNGARLYANWTQREGMRQVLMRQDGTVLQLSAQRARILVP